MGILWYALPNLIATSLSLNAGKEIDMDGESGRKKRKNMSRLLLLTTALLLFPMAYAQDTNPNSGEPYINDQSNPAPIQANPTTSNVVFTGGTGAATGDVISYHCEGNPN